MTDLRLTDKYSLAKCCSPARGDSIVGYFSFDDHCKVHRADCANLGKAEPSRTLKLEWDQILVPEAERPDEDLAQLSPTDFAVLRHHRDYDIDYSLKVARMLGIEKQAAFDSHQKLRGMGLLERVDATMVQYRKGVVENKWIKHRNHTYYRLTNRGRMYLAFVESSRS